ncbi:MAG: hypothetical protein IPM64_11010 [Phycisphaerales bacterium]|nr:hypothetical protein [Phycisphaerales bacterium]
MFEDFSIPPPAEVGEGGPITLRDLIAHIVRIEVAAFEERRHARRIDRVLSTAQIEREAARGRISPEGQDPRRPPAAVDVETAIATALEAFADGLYLVIIDDLEYRELGAIVCVGPDSRITFVRLTFLAGA